VSTLALGGEIEVPTMSGRVKMKLPPGSQNGRTLRLAGQGMPQLKAGKKGDLYVKVNALLPTALNEQQRELFRQLAQAGA
jgi:DnaJ-class molecular chaperone